jgi:hypothetical protein
VFEEGYEMIRACILLYGIVDLRTLARNGLVEEPRLLSLPISSHDIVPLVWQHKSTIDDHLGDDSSSSSAQMYLDAFDSSISKNIRNTTSSTIIDNDNDLEGNYVNASTTTTSFDHVNVVDVDDEHSNEELVYGICVNTARRRITVIFQGWARECSCPRFRESIFLFENAMESRRMIFLYSCDRSHAFGRILSCVSI